MRWNSWIGFELARISSLVEWALGLLLKASGLSGFIQTSWWLTCINWKRRHRRMTSHQDPLMQNQPFALVVYTYCWICRSQPAFGGSNGLRGEIWIWDSASRVSLNSWVSQQQQQQQHGSTAIGYICKHSSNIEVSVCFELIPGDCWWLFKLNLLQTRNGRNMHLIRSQFFSWQTPINQLFYRRDLLADKTCARSSLKLGNFCSERLLTTIKALVSC